MHQQKQGYVNYRFLKIVKCGGTRITGITKHENLALAGNTMRFKPSDNFLKFKKEANILYIMKYRVQFNVHQHLFEY